MARISDTVNKPQVRTIVSVIVFIVFGVVFLKIALGLWRENNRLKSQIEKETKEITGASQIEPLTNSILMQTKKVTSEVSSIENTFCTNPEEVFSDLNRFALSSQINLSSINPIERMRMEIPHRKDKYLELLPIKIKASCGFNQILIFLNKIETCRKGIAVTNLKIQSNATNIWNHEIEIDLKIPLLLYSNKNE